MAGTGSPSLMDLPGIVILSGFSLTLLEAVFASHGTGLAIDPVMAVLRAFEGFQGVHAAQDISMHEAGMLCSNWMVMHLLCLCPRRTFGRLHSHVKDRLDWSG